MSDEDQVPSRLTSARRISLPLKEDGSGIDWDRVSGTIEERFVNAVKDDPDTLEKIGLAQGGEGGSDEVGGADVFDGITDANIKSGLDMLTALSGGMFKLAVGRVGQHPFKKRKNGKPAGIEIDPDIIQQSFQLTEKQHEELDPRARRLANKAAPEWLKKHADLTMLVSMYFMYLAENAKQAVSMQVSRDIQGAQQASRQQPPQRGNGVAATVPPPPVSQTEPEGTQPIL